MKFIDSIFNAGTSMLQKDRDRKAVEKQRKADQAILSGLDFEPMYTSELAPTYK